MTFILTSDKKSFDRKLFRSSYFFFLSFFTLNTYIYIPIYFFLFLSICWTHQPSFPLTFWHKVNQLNFNGNALVSNANVNSSFCFYRFFYICCSCRYCCWFCCTAEGQYRIKYNGSFQNNLKLLRHKWWYRLSFIRLSCLLSAH